MRTLDAMLQTPSFRAALADADACADTMCLDQWAVRIVWVGVRFNVMVARRFAMRRQNYQSSAAWACFTRLVDAGWFSVDPEGVVFDESEDSDAEVEEWFLHLCSVAAGEV